MREKTSKCVGALSRRIAAAPIKRSRFRLEYNCDSDLEIRIKRETQGNELQPNVTHCARANAQ